MLGQLSPSLPPDLEVSSSSPPQKIEILGQLPPSLPPGFEVSGPPQPQQQVQVPSHSVGVSTSSVSSTCPPAGLSSMQAQMPHDSGHFLLLIYFKHHQILVFFFSSTRAH